MKKEGEMFLSSLFLGLLLALFYLYTESEIVVLAVTFIVSGVIERIYVFGKKEENNVVFNHYKDLLIVYMYLAMISILLLKYVIFPIFQIEQGSNGFLFLFLMGFFLLTLLNVYLFKGVKKVIDDFVRRRG
ncbi:hypothetical protein ACYSNO_04175 [Enterococcus sp. LJL98]